MTLTTGTVLRRSASRWTATGILSYRTNASPPVMPTTRKATAARKATRGTGTPNVLARKLRDLALFQDMLKSTLILGASAS